MPRRFALVTVLALVLATLSMLSPSATTARQTREISIRPDATTAAVSRLLVVPLDRPADNVAAYWRGNPHARVTLAFSTDGTHFGPEQAAGRDELGGQRQDGTTYGALVPAHGAVAARATTDRPIARLTVLGLTDGQTTTHRAPAQLGSPAEAATTQPTVVSRTSWGADPAYMTWTPAFYATKKLVVHHTDTSDDYTDQAGAEAQIRAIYYYHSVTQGWGDIGYNFLIDKFGNVYEGRYSRDYPGANPSGDDASGQGVTGAHTKGWNSGTVGVALLGTLTTHDATPAARQALEALLAWEASRNGIDPEATSTFVNPVSGATITTPNIAGHRDYVATACPGDTFYPTLPLIRAETAAMITGTPFQDTTAPTAPTGLKATPGRTQVTLGWNPATDNVGVTRYQVWRSRSATTGFSQVGTPTGTSFVSGSLSRRTTYYFRVRAVDGTGNVGRFSSTVSARTT